jgi:hypothetical protein
MDNFDILNCEKKREKEKRLKESIIKNPYLNGFLNDRLAEREKEILAKYYNDIDEIVARSKSFPWNDLQSILYKYNRDCFNKGEIGWIQQAYDAAIFQTSRTRVEVAKYHECQFVITPPCDLDVDITGPKCRLLWGSSRLFDTCVYVYQFDFYMSGREFIVSGGSDDNFCDCPDSDDAVTDLSVLLLRGERFKDPRWGELVI